MSPNWDQSKQSDYNHIYISTLNTCFAVAITHWKNTHPAVKSFDVRKEQYICDKTAFLCIINAFQRMCLTQILSRCAFCLPFWLLFFKTENSSHGFSVLIAISHASVWHIYMHVTELNGSGKWLKQEVNFSFTVNIIWCWQRFNYCNVFNAVVTQYPARQYIPFDLCMSYAGFCFS